jgi:hypothetical protein
MRQKHKNTRIRLQRIMNEHLLRGMSQAMALEMTLQSTNVPKKHRRAITMSAMARGKFK